LGSQENEKILAAKRVPEEGAIIDCAQVIAGSLSLISFFLSCISFYFSLSGFRLGRKKLHQLPFFSELILPMQYFPSRLAFLLLS
jgi:hypothetical protein